MSNTGAMVPRTYEQRSPHNRVVAVVLWWFLGLLGGHRFYVGKYGTGILMALLTLFSFGIIGGIWWIADLVLLATGRFTDSEGRVLGPPQVVYEDLPEPHALAFEPELEPLADDGGDWDEEVMRDPLEDKFAELEQQIGQK